MSSQAQQARYLENTTMIIPNAAAAPIQNANHKQCSYYADVPRQLLDERSDLIDRLMSFAFDTLGARYLEVHVRVAE